MRGFVPRPEPAARSWLEIAERRIVVSFATVTEMRYGVRKAGWIAATAMHLGVELVSDDTI